MIERFNFYDLYGYLLPGSALIAALFVPFLITRADAPVMEWSSALATLVLAYFAGHLLQIVARPALKEPEQPSDRILDPEKSTLPPQYRSELVKMIEEQFGFDLTDKTQRRLAFDACRYAIQSKEVPSYAEQFQGLYAMMRGLCAAAILAGSHQLGWIAGAVLPQVVGLWSIGLACALFGGAIWFATSRPSSPGLFWIACGLAVVAGIPLGPRMDHPDHVRVAAFFTAALWLSSYLFFGSFKYFAGRFAETVYNVYYARADPAIRSRRRTRQAFE